MSKKRRQRKELLWRICPRTRKAYLARSHKECRFCKGHKHSPQSFLDWLLGEG